MTFVSLIYEGSEQNFHGLQLMNIVCFAVQTQTTTETLTWNKIKLFIVRKFQVLCGFQQCFYEQFEFFRESKKLLTYLLKLK